MNRKFNINFTDDLVFISFCPFFLIIQTMGDNGCQIMSYFPIFVGLMLDTSTKRGTIRHLTFLLNHRVRPRAFYLFLIRFTDKRSQIQAVNLHLTAGLLEPNREKLCILRCADRKGFGSACAGWLEPSCLRATFTNPRLARLCSNWRIGCSHSWLVTQLQRRF